LFAPASGKVSLARGKFKPLGAARNQGSGLRLDRTGSQPRLKNMKMLKRLFQLNVRPDFLFFWRHPERRKSLAYPAPLIDPEEFASLIGSGRVEDLRILARKLSAQPKAHA
jgi:hypothetical protein